MFTRRAHYEKLILWQRAMDLVAEVYRLVEGFPDSEKSGLSGALKKAATTIPGKVAEADEAKNPTQAIKSLYSARAALVELLNQALIARRVKVMGRLQLARLRSRCRKLDRLIQQELERQEQAIAKLAMHDPAPELPTTSTTQDDSPPADTQHSHDTAAPLLEPVITHKPPVARVVMRRRPRFTDAA